MISLKDVTGALSEANKDKQELSEALKQAKDENQKLAESLSKANEENEKLMLHLSQANTLLETLRAENEEQAKFRERSEELIKRNLDLLTETMKRKEELEKTLQYESQSKEKLKKTLKVESESRILAQQNEKELEQQMESWLLDAKSEKYKSTLSLQNLSECLNRETAQRMKADVTRELTGKDKDKLETLLREEQDKCKQLEIKIETQEFKMNQLQEIINHERTDHDKKMITEKYEKALIVKDIKIAEEREERLKTLINEKETDLNKINHDKEVMEKKNKELKEQLEQEKKKTESLLKEVKLKAC